MSVREDRPGTPGTGAGVPVVLDLVVWAALLGLLALSLFAAYQKLGWLNTPIGLAIAAAKGLLVGTIFMGLGKARPLLRLAAAAGFFWVVILFALTLSDILTRPVWPM